MAKVIDFNDRKKAATSKDKKTEILPGSAVAEAIDTVNQLYVSIDAISKEADEVEGGKAFLGVFLKISALQSSDPAKFSKIRISEAKEQLTTWPNDQLKTFMLNCSDNTINTKPNFVAAVIDVMIGRGLMS